MPLDFQITFQDTDPQDNVRIRRNESTLFDNSNPDSPSVVGELIDKTMQSGEEGGISLLHSVSFGNDVRQFPQPFMFTMQASDRHPMVNNQNGFARILCLYDNAGESFDPDPSQMEWELQTRHLSRSKLLLFTFDPTRDPRLQQRIREHSPGRLPKAVPGVAQEPYFQEAAKRIKKYAGLSRRDRHKAPLVIAVTKFDVWSDIIGEIDR
ncbi:MAG: hypothetical protein QGH11_14510, partial [Pirellulaceae bacterium]|nr:hypothetical protein [Pirellulaceae bacterium]